MGSSAAGSLNGGRRTTPHRKGRPQTKRPALPTAAERRARREEAIEAANAILDQNGGTIMSAMIGIALDPNADERARGSIGMKLIDKLIPTKTGPLVEINARPTFISHLNLPTKPVSRDSLPEAIPTTSSPREPARQIEASRMSTPPKPSYQKVEKPTTASAAELPTFSLDSDKAPDSLVSVNAETRDVSPAGQRTGKGPAKRVGW